MEGIDLITEGILTLSKVERLLTQGIPEKSQGPANDLVNLIQNSDKITFIVGTRINVAHQDPNLPVELEIRRNVVKKIKYLLICLSTISLLGCNETFRPYALKV